MITNIKDSIRQGCAALLVIAALFLLAEPAISLSATTSQFTISQVVSSEVSFSTPASNVTLSPSLGGLTGGTSNGGTQFIVLTNDHLGYHIDLTASSSVGMLGNTNSSNSIPALVPASSGVPDFAFDSGSVAVNKAYFAYTVEASTTADTGSLFKDDGVNCNTGSGNTENKCWLNAGTGAVTIINRTSQTASSGATTTLRFRVVMQANPNPLIPDDTYVATTTLTAVVN